ncbi:unnamed protein product [Pieris brassicae]|uniref:Uncharacterized protein n=1 Tax=Pieris brassicae TaxID=7116 RepID=A0A9P0TQT8_PIEBR|nr:unnamed protein product [Pieris brassicae]
MTRGQKPGRLGTRNRDDQGLETKDPDTRIQTPGSRHQDPDTRIHMQEDQDPETRMTRSQGIVNKQINKKNIYLNNLINPV